MSNHNCGQYGIRNHTHKKEQYWKLHISRSVAPSQVRLRQGLEQLEEHNSDIIKFKKIGNLGLTLVMIEHLLHKIFGMSAHEKIPRTKLTSFAAELNSIDEIAQSSYCFVELADPMYPYCISGSRYFGLQVKSNEELTEGRKAIINYVTDKYTISKHRARNRLKSLDPHITLGSVILNNLDRYERADMFNNPNSFIDQRIRERIARLECLPNVECAKMPIMPPRICLNGIVVEPKPARRL